MDIADEAKPSRGSRGWRKLFAVVAPSTNTSVQPEYDSMRPVGVTNPIARISIPTRG